MGENIGAAARAMKNFGLCDLRLVAPRDGWPNPLAVTMSVGASDLLDSARVYPTLREATADLTYLYAATARRRFMNKPYVISRALGADFLVASSWAAAAGPPLAPAAGATAGVGGEGGGQQSGARVGIAFGRESSGLTNEEVAMAAKIVVVDSEPAFPVLNLAQAVLVCCYELAPALRGGLRLSGGGPCGSGVSSGTGGMSSSSCDEDNGALSAGDLSDGGSVWAWSSGSGSLGSFGGGGGGGGSLLRSGFLDAVGSGGGSGGVQSGNSGVAAAAAAAAEAVMRRPELANEQQLATLGDAEEFLDHLFAELDAAGYFEVASRRPSTEGNIRNLLRRVPQLSKQEVATLHGIVSKLAGRRYDRQQSQRRRPAPPGGGGGQE